MAIQQSILMVDDYTPNLISLEAVLDQGAWTLLKASSGIEALEILAEKDISLILLDVQMPGMDGYELADMISKNKKLQHMPVIFLSAVHCDDKSVLRGYELGGVDYLCKPLNPLILKAKVDFFMKADKRRRELELLAAAGNRV